MIVMFTMEANGESCQPGSLWKKRVCLPSQFSIYLLPFSSRLSLSLSQCIYEVPGTNAAPDICFSFYFFLRFLGKQTEHGSRAAFSFFFILV